MTTVAPPLESPSSKTANIGGFLGRHPLIVLSGVLVILILVTAAIEPNYLSVSGLRGTALIAAPVGILAASQTILMITGGIDLSAAMVATAAAYITAAQADSGSLVAIGLGILVGIGAGAANGIGVGIFRVNPLIMTIALSGIIFGLFSSWAQGWLAGSTIVGDFVRTIGGKSFLDNNIPYAVVGGNAVQVWVAQVDEGAVRNIRDVDILLKRDTLDDAITALAPYGFHYQEVAGVSMFLDRPDGKPSEAVHIIFAGEKVRAEYTDPAPELNEREFVTTIDDVLAALDAKGIDPASRMEVLAILYSFKDEILFK